MAKLNYMDRDNLLKEFEIQEDLITIGREATNKLVVADPSVSRQHAWVERKEDGYYLVDKNSSNGTFINGKKVSQQKLNHNDKVSLGNASLVFEDEEQVQATFILPRKEVPLEQQDTEPQKKEEPMALGERPTAAVDLTPPPRPAVPLTPPPPPAARPPVPPPPPAPAPPPAAAPAPAAASPTVCPQCKKPLEPGARFCGSCGASISAAAARSTPAPAPSPSAAPPPRPAAPPPPQARPAAPPVVPPPQPISKPGMAPPPPMAAPSMPGAGPVMQPAGGPLVYAGFGPRFVAVLIDGFIISLLNLLPTAIGIFVYMSSAAETGVPSAGATVVFGLCMLVTLIINIGYNLYFVGAKGATPGKKVMKLKITFPDGTYPIGYGKAFIRMIGWSISAMICYIGFLMALFDKETHKALHDKIAGTVVIRES